METRIVVPNLGESVIEATVLRWLKNPGDPVKTGEALVELETDKVNIEVSAERDGVLLRADRQIGEDVRVGDALGAIGDSANGQGSEPQKTEGKQTQKLPEAEPVAIPEQREIAKSMEKEPEETQGEQPPVPERMENKLSEQKVEKLTPVARRYAEENRIDLTQVSGSGPQGRITRQDLESLADNKEGQVNFPAKENATGREAQPAPQPGRPTPSEAQEGREERVRMSRRRRTIAQNLVQAQQSAALLTTFNDVDMTAVMEIRKVRKEAFKTKYGVSLGIVSFFVKASILALKDFPRINAEMQGDEMVLKHYYDIGVAVGAEEGLVVPVLRDADRMSFSEMEKAIQGYTQKVREGTLSLEDLQGGTFTITNGGVFGSLLSTPIINAPQVGILGLHRIEDRPVVRNGNVVVRQMMYLALTYDHRIVDGREAVQFLVRVKEAIENPEVMLLEL